VSSSFNNSIAVDEIVIDTLRVSVVERIRNRYPMVARNLTVTPYLPYDTAEHVDYIFSSFLANIHKTDKTKTQLYKYPATPWEYLKEKYAPVWFLKRRPVRYDTKDVAVSVERNFMCPHIDTPDLRPHVVYLRDGTPWYPLLEYPMAPPTR